MFAASALPLAEFGWARASSAPLGQVSCPPPRWAGRALVGGASDVWCRRAPLGRLRFRMCGPRARFVSVPVRPGGAPSHRVRKRAPRSFSQGSGGRARPEPSGPAFLDPPALGRVCSWRRGRRRALPTGGPRASAHLCFRKSARDVCLLFGRGAGGVREASGAGAALLPAGFAGGGAIRRICFSRKKVNIFGDQIRSRKPHYRATFHLFRESQVRFATGKQWSACTESETHVFSRKTYFGPFFSDLPIEEGDNTFEIKHVREPLVPPAEEHFGQCKFHA